MNINTERFLKKSRIIFGSSLSYSEDSCAVYCGFVMAAEPVFFSDFSAVRA